MLVLGPSPMWNVPGHFNTAVLMTWESNAPHGPYPPISKVRGRYYYKAHPMLAMDWDMPLGAHWPFEGYTNYIAAKGRSEMGQPKRWVVERSFAWLEKNRRLWKNC